MKPVKRWDDLSSCEISGGPEDHKAAWTRDLYVTIFNAAKQWLSPRFRVHQITSATNLSCFSTLCPFKKIAEGGRQGSLSMCAFRKTFDPTGLSLDSLYFLR